MSLLLKNISKLYTPDLQKGFGSVKVFENFSVLLKEDKIAEISESKSLYNAQADSEVDASGMCLFPGFVDAHTHPVFWKTRESEFIMRIQGHSYEEIAAAGGGIRNSARSFQKASRNNIKDHTRLRLREFLIHGTTTIEAKSGYGLTTTDEIKSLEIIRELNSEQPLEMVPTFLGAHEIPDEYRDNRSEYIQIIKEEMIPRVSGEKLAEYCDVFCEKGVFTIDESREILLEAKRYGLKSRLHADELFAFGGAELAAEINAVTADHLVKISQYGIKKMAEHGVIPVLLPVTTFFLRKDEYAPARDMINAGCEIALATDFNPGSAMTQNMQLVWSIAALKMGLLPGELLWATTIIPAKSIAKEHKIGSIERGKQADLVLMNIPNMDYLPYHLGVNHVFVTIKKGKIAFQRSMKGNKVC
jgi:imidazolonepropionase